MKVENKGGKGNPYHDNKSGEFTTANSHDYIWDDEEDEYEDINENNNQDYIKSLFGLDIESDNNDSDEDPYSKKKKENALDFQGFYTSESYYKPKSLEIYKESTPEERKAADTYSISSGKFNRPLAGYDLTWNNFKGIGKVSLNNELKNGEEQINAFTRLISKSKTQDDAYVYSGHYTQIAENIFNMPQGSMSSMSDEELQELIGKEGECSSFLSTRVCKSGGGDFATREFQMRIYVPKGSQMLYMGPFGIFSSLENEAVLQRGSRFRITNITRNKYGFIHADVELRLDKQNQYAYPISANVKNAYAQKKIKTPLEIKLPIDSNGESGGIVNFPITTSDKKNNNQNVVLY